MQNKPMRTTVTLNDETHAFANYYAHARGLTLSGAIDELIRKAQAVPAPKPEICFSPISGLPMFLPRGGTITAEKVKEIEEEEFDPKLFT
jgi:nitrite reductase/ring-hydroxylating ferredoxin subunit